MARTGNNKRTGDEYCTKQSSDRSGLAFFSVEMFVASAIAIAMISGVSLAAASDHSLCKVIHPTFTSSFFT